METQEYFTVSPPEKGRAYYRYEDHQTACGYLDESDDYVLTGFGKCTIILREFLVDKETPRGVWISREPDGMPRKWIGNNWRKRYACPTKEEAWNSFIARKRSQQRILSNKLNAIESLLKIPPPTKEDIAHHNIYDPIVETVYTIFRNTSVYPLITL